jgi:hypothetical protein
VNTGQCGESSETKVNVHLTIPEDDPIRPKHVVGKTYDIFMSLTNCVDGEYNNNAPDLGVYRKSLWTDTEN